MGIGTFFTYLKKKRKPIRFPFFSRNRSFFDTIKTENDYAKEKKMGTVLKGIAVVLGAGLLIWFIGYLIYVESFNKEIDPYTLQDYWIIDERDIGDDTWEYKVHLAYLNTMGQPVERNMWFNEMDPSDKTESSRHYNLLTDEYEEELSLSQTDFDSMIQEWENE